MVNVLYIIDSFDGPVGGTEKQLIQLISNIYSFQFKPLLAVFRRTTYLSTHPMPCEVVTLDIHKLCKLSSLLNLIKLINYIRKYKIELVHIFFNDASIIAPFFCKLAGARVIVSRRDMGFWYSSKNLIALRLSNLFVDCVIANSTAVAENVSKIERIHRSKIAVVYNGYEPEEICQQSLKGFREEHNIGYSDPIIGIVANMSPIKRHSDLLKAFSIVKERFNNAHLVLIGTGSNEVDLRQHCQSLHIESHVHFLGQLTNVIPIIKHFTLCVLCSESEGLSNSIMEYMACSKPIICTNVGGNPELIKDGYNGFLIKVGDIHTLSDRMITILSDPILSQTLGNNALSTISGNFHKEIMLKSYTKVYESLIS